MSLRERTRPGWGLSDRVYRHPTWRDRRRRALRFRSVIATDITLVRAQRPLCGIDADGLEVRSREGQDMPQPSFVLVSSLLLAAGVAVSVYTLAHDALGLSRHLIMYGSFGLAAGLAVASVVTIRRAK